VVGVLARLVDVFAKDQPILVLDEKVARGVGLATNLSEDGGDIYVNVWILVEHPPKPAEVVAVPGHVSKDEGRFRMARGQIVALGHQGLERRVTLRRARAT